MENGFIVLGDVSGYGEFIASTELDHSREILSELLGALCESAPGNLTVAQLEGDAVFWLCGEDAAGLVDLLKEKFAEFHRRLRFIILASICSCRACASAGSLSVKFVVHHGAYVRQRVAGSDHFVGNDIVLAHRLLKNDVPSHEYILLTEQALAALAPADSVPHEEHIEHIGVVRCGYIELSNLRADALAERTEHLERHEAHAIFERAFPVPLETIRSAFRDESLHGITEHFELLEDPLGLEDGAEVADGNAPFVPRAGMKHVIVRRGARGTALGQETHCHHREDGTKGSTLRLIRSERGPTESRTSMHVVGHSDGSSFYVTQIVSAAPTGCALELRYAWEPIADPATTAPDWLPGLVDELFDRLAVVVERIRREIAAP